MIQLHFDVKQLKIGKTMGALHSFMWNYIKYANMEGFRRDSIMLIGCYHSYNLSCYVCICNEYQNICLVSLIIYVTKLCSSIMYVYTVLINLVKCSIQLLHDNTARS